MSVSHPAKYSDALLPVFARLLQGCPSILDPMAGTGKIFKLQELLRPTPFICGIELEPEWACLQSGMVVGNALRLPFPDQSFSAINVSCTYGNRLADHHVAKDGSLRHSYTHDLGHPLHPDNSGQLQWGTAYQDFHWAAWAEARRVLLPHGRFVLNIKDHIRKGQVVPVTAFHVACLTDLGFIVREEVCIETPALRYGANREARVPYESVILLELK